MCVSVYVLMCLVVCVSVRAYVRACVLACVLPRELKVRRMEREKATMCLSLPNQAENRH